MKAAWRSRTVRRLIVAGTAVLLIVLASSGTAGAATLVVDSTVDAVDDNPGNGVCATSGGQCTLRAAIEEANALAGDDTITLPGGTYTVGSEIAISSNVTLNGAGAASTIIQAAATASSANHRVFSVSSGVVSISGVTVRHGNLADHGAGIQNFGTLTVTDSTFQENNSGTTRHGGAIQNTTGAKLVVVRSSFIGNSASEGGAIQNRGTATITNSTFSVNGASNSGGGLDNIGNDVTTAVVNSTFSFNSAGSGGGIFNIFGAVTLVNTIVAGNSGSSTREDCFGAGITSLGHNLVGIGTGCPTGASGDLTTADAKLGTLQDNGGPTFTHALLSGSPAIDAGDDGAAPATDQRGTSRPQGAASDIGAFELVTGVAVPSLSVWGLVAMALLLAAAYLWRARRRSNRQPV